MLDLQPDVFFILNHAHIVGDEVERSAGYVDRNEDTDLFNIHIII